MAANSKKFYLGIDLGGTKCLVALLNRRFEVVATLKERTDPGQSFTFFFKNLVESIDAILEEMNISHQSLLGIGMGSAGMIKNPPGIILASPNLPFLTRAPLQRRLSAKYRCPVFIENDVNAGLYGEAHFGVASGKENVVGIFPGTGVGGAMILNGALYRGAFGGAGEIGHTYLDYMGGIKDPARRSTVEGATGRLALSADASLLMARGQAPYLVTLVGNNMKKMKSRAFARAIAAGDQAVLELVQDKARLLGIVMANMVNILNPEMIVLGGGLIEALERILVPAATASMKEHALPALVKGVRVRAARLKDHAIIMGAAKLVAESIQSRVKK